MAGHESVEPVKEAGLKSDRIDFAQERSDAVSTGCFSSRQIEPCSQPFTFAAGPPGDGTPGSRKQNRQAIVGRSKDLTIHDTIECPVDPATLPPDAVRLGDEPVVIQDIEIQPRNTRYQRHVYYSAAEKKFYRGPLPSGYGNSSFGPDLRALILSLKYCGNMSEAKIREFLENFDVQVSAGSLSNILTNTAAAFEQEYHDLLTAGLSSTSYQQTDDTSARVQGESWHTHILCNPFYTAYSTRSSKDRLAVLSVLQNTDNLRFRFNAETLELLQDEFTIPVKWQTSIAALGEDVEFAAEALKALLDDWFGKRNNANSHFDRTRGGDRLLPPSNFGPRGGYVGLRRRGAVQVAHGQVGFMLDSCRTSLRASFAPRRSAREIIGMPSLSDTGTTTFRYKIIVPARPRSCRQSCD